MEQDLSSWKRIKDKTGITFTREAEKSTEFIRFAFYGPGQNKYIRAYYNKIEEWKIIEGYSKVFRTEDIYKMFNVNLDSRIDSVINHVKDIFNGRRK